AQVSQALGRAPRAKTDCAMAIRAEDIWVEDRRLPDQVWSLAGIVEVQVARDFMLGPAFHATVRSRRETLRGECDEVTVGRVSLAREAHVQLAAALLEITPIGVEATFARRHEATARSW